MDKEVERRLSDITTILKETNKELAKLGGENIALRAVCAILLADVASTHKDPTDHLAKTLAGMQGAIHGLGLMARDKSPELNKTAVTISRVIEGVCAMAEAVISKPPVPPE